MNRSLFESFPSDVVLPVHAVYRGATAEALHRVATARRETPQALATAIVERALRDGRAEEILGDARAELMVAGQGRRPVEGGETLTMQQCAVLYLIGRRGGMAGACGWSAAALARMMPEVIGEKNVSNVIAALQRKRLIVRPPQAGRAPRPMTLTDLGRAVWRELSGDFGDG